MNQVTLTQDAEKPRVAVVPLVVLLAGLVALFTRLVARMWIGWFPGWVNKDQSIYHRLVDGESYYTHGPLAMLVSIFLFVFLLRHTVIPLRPSKLLGGVMAALMLAIYLFASVLDINLIRGVASVGLIAAVVILFWGLEAAKRLWFPILFLLFMIPLSMWLISDLNLSLKLWATNAGVQIVNVLGISAERSGAQIMLIGDKTLVVGNVCSGLRTLISLLAFGAVFAYICRVRGWWRLLLFVLTVPVALVANCLRIASIIVVAQIWDVKTATGTYHDTSGFVVFVLAFLMMFGLEKLILAAHSWAGRPMKIVPMLLNVRQKDRDRDQGARLLGAIRGPGAYAIGGLGIVLGISAWWMDRPMTSMWTQNIADKALPMLLQAPDGRTLVGQRFALDEQTLTMLETGDYLYRKYAGLSEPMDMCVIFSKDNPTSTHPPEVCLGAAGGETMLAQDVVVDQVETVGDLHCRELLIRKGQDLSYYLYTFKYGDSYTARFGKQQIWVFFMGRLIGNASGALIRVSTPVPPSDSLEEARQRAFEMMRITVPYLTKSLK